MMSESPKANFAEFRGAPPRTPGVWIWYVAYCAFMALFHLTFVTMAALMFVFADTLAEWDREVESPAPFQILALAVAAWCLPMTLVFAIGPLLPKSKFAWIYGLVLMAIGLTSGCSLPAAVPLIIFWVKPETKAFLRMR